MGIWEMRVGPLAQHSRAHEEWGTLQKVGQWFMEYFLGQLFTLYRYIHPIAKYQIYYDRKYYGKAVERIAEGYDLFAFHSSNPKTFPLTFPMTISKPILFQQIFMFAMTIRCAIVTFVPELTVDPELRSWWGIDVWHGRGGMYADISIMLWSLTCACFITFGLSNRILDYKFMAVYFIVRDGPEWLHPRQFDLGEEDYEQYRKYRKICMKIQVFITFTAFPIGVLFQMFVYWYGGYFYSKPIQSFLWFVIYFFWFAYICFLLYGNLIAFCVVAMYLCIKKRRYVERMKGKKRGQWIQWTSIIKWALKITHLHDELQDYYRVFFWFMSFFFGNMVMIFCNFIYVMFLGRAIPWILRGLIGWVTIVHIVIIQSIIYFSDDILKQNKRVVHFILGWCSQPSRARQSLSVSTRLKIHHLYVEFSQNKIAFRVINGFVLRRSTVLILLIDITTCVMLLYKKQGNSEQFGNIFQR